MLRLFCIYTAVTCLHLPGQARNSQAETLSVSAWSKISWTDPFLTWSPEYYQGITTIVLPSSALWTPDIAHVNSINGVLQKDKVESIRAVVTYNGSVTWYPGGTYTSSCPVDITYFPFDYQKCVLTFVSWSHDQSLLSLTPSSTTIDAAGYVENGEWMIISTEVQWDHQQGQGYFDYIHFVLHMRRRSLFYIINILLPVIILSLLELCVFWLPPQSDEKVSLAITIMLGFSVFAMVIDANIPSTSTSTPIVVISTMVSMCLAAISVVSTVVAIALHHKSCSSDKSLSKNLHQTSTDESQRDVISGSETTMDTNKKPTSKDFRFPSILRCIRNNSASYQIESHRTTTNWQNISRLIDKIMFCIMACIVCILFLVVVIKIEGAPSK